MIASRIICRLLITALPLVALSGCSQFGAKRSGAEPTPVPSPQGQETHGGDRLASIFVAKGYRIYDYLVRPSTIDHILTAEQAADFFAALRSTRVEPVVGPLLASPGAIVNARNLEDPLFPGQKLIQLDQKIWETFFSRGDDVNRLVLHEYLWVIGIDDQNYQISNRLALVENPIGGLGSWQEMSELNAPIVDFQRLSLDVGTAFAGNRLLITQGDSAACRDIHIAAYDLTRSKWMTTDIDAPGAVGASYSLAARDDEVFLWGGVCLREDGLNVSLQTGILFNAADQSWRALASVGAPTARRGATAIATPQGFFVWGGVESKGFAASGSIYDPASDEWQAISKVSPPPPGEYRGAYIDENSPSAFKGSVLLWQPSSKKCEPTAAIYELATKKWRQLLSPNAPAYACDWAHAIWTGERFAFIFQYSQQNDDSGEIAGAFWDPAKDEWKTIPASELLHFRTGASLVWAQDKLVIFGGMNIDDTPLNTGVAFFPESKSFRSLRWEGAPFGRSEHIAYWTGDRMVVWGGKTLSMANIRSGSLWNPN